MAARLLPRAHTFQFDSCFSPKSQSLAVLHDSSSSPVWQRTHFNTHFVPAWKLRGRLSAKVDLFECFALLQDGLRKMASCRTWLALQTRLKLRSTMRRYAAPVCRGLKEQRERLLGEWLQYWRACEAKSMTVVQVRKSCSVSNLNTMTSSLAQSLARASVNTPDWLKATVVWDLYWLLRAQHNVKVLRHWRRWYALRRRRAELRQQVREGTYKGSKENDALDATHVETMSLPTVNAAIFLLILNPPRFQATPGKHVKVQDLVRLANGNLNLDFTEFCDTPFVEIRQIPPTVSPFLSSPLCDDPGWIRQRCHQPVPIIPPAPEGAEGGGPTSRSGSPGASETVVCCVQRPDSGAGSFPQPQSRMPALSPPRRISSNSPQRPPGLTGIPRSPSFSPPGSTGGLSPPSMGGLSPLGSTGGLSPPKAIFPDLQNDTSRHRSRLSPSKSLGGPRNMFESFPAPSRKSPRALLPALTPLDSSWPSPCRARTPGSGHVA